MKKLLTASIIACSVVMGVGLVNTIVPKQQVATLLILLNN